MSAAMSSSANTSNAAGANAERTRPPIEVGARVRVREDFPIGHFRTPVYVRGKTGVVTASFGAFEDPELVAYCLKGPKRWLYAVRFEQVDLWNNYQGPDRDTVELELYEHWLEPLGDA
jgi:nitrile hydratase